MTAAGNSSNGLNLDFALHISNATKQGINHARNAISVITDDVKTIKSRWHEVTNELSKQKGAISNNTDASSRLLETLKGYTKAAIGIYSIGQAFNSVFSAGERLDDMLKENMIAFNGYTNSLAAYQKFQSGIIGGKLLGDAKEYMQSATILMSQGIRMTDDITNQLNNWGAATGKSVSQVASAIESAIQGNTSAFAEFGITERTMRQFSRYTAGTTQMRDAVLGFVKAQHQFDGAAKNAPMTWKNIADRLRAMKDKFLESIIGAANDPNSLNNMVKRTITSTLDFLAKNARTFKAIAGTISAILKYIFKQVGNFVEFMVGKAQQGIDTMQNFVSNWKERVAGFILYLELIKLRFIDFYHAHKKVIDGLIKYYLIFKVAKWALMIPYRIIGSVIAYGKAAKAMLGILANTRIAGVIGEYTGIFAGRIYNLVLPALARMGVSLTGINALIVANPIGAVVLAISAAVGSAYLLWKHWDSITGAVKKMPSWLVLLVGAIFPFTRAVMFVLRYWGEIKNIIVNIGVIIANVAQILWYSFKSALKKTGNFFKSMFKDIWNAMPDFIKDFGGFLYNSLAYVANKIKDFFSWIVPQWLKDGVNWVVGAGENSMMGNVSQGFTNMAANTGRLATDLGGNGINGVQLDRKTGNLVNNAPLMSQYPNVGGRGATKIENTTTIQNGAIQINNTNGLNEEQVGKKVSEHLEQLQRKQHLKGRQQ
jgi:hypothetical protein